MCLLKLSQTRSTASPSPSSLFVALFCFHVNMYFFKQIILFSVLDQEFCLKFYSRDFDQNPQCWIQIYPLTNSSQERQLDMQKARNKSPSSDSYKEEKDYESQEKGLLNNSRYKDSTSVAETSESIFNMDFFFYTFLNSSHNLSCVL